MSRSRRSYNARSLRSPSLIDACRREIPDTMIATAPTMAILTIRSKRTSPLSSSMPLSIACWMRIGTTTLPAAATAANIHVTPRP